MRKCITEVSGQNQLGTEFDVWRQGHSPKELVGSKMFCQGANDSTYCENFSSTCVKETKYLKIRHFTFLHGF
jgi:hypothetical protein